MGASDQELTGRVAIVTGPGAGIGAGIAAMLAEAGAAVTVADIDGESAASTAKGIESKGGRAITVTADVSDAREIDAMVRQTVTDLGGVDILVNNASIATTELVEDLDEEKWRGVLDVNLTGPFLCCKAVLPHMRRKRWGRIERRAGRRRWTLPSTRRGDASPTPWTRGGRRGSDCARFGELLARALLRALARRDAGVHQDIALAGDKGGPGLDPREPFVERGAELPADLVERRGAAPLEQRHLVIADDAESIQAARQLEDPGAVGPAIDQVAAQRDPVPVAVEAGDLEQVAQLRGAALDIADEQDVTHDVLVA